MTTKKNRVYTPLEQGQFRLLHLLPRRDWHRSDFFNDVIVTGFLDGLSFGASPSISYKTISYSWGEATTREFMLFDEDLLDAQRSTCDALRAICQEDRPQVVWTDAVCINQQDIDERTMQARQMSSICRLGQRCLLLLGTGGSLADRAMLNVSTIAKRCVSDVGSESYHVQLVSGRPADVDIDIEAPQYLFTERVFGSGRPST